MALLATTGALAACGTSPGPIPPATSANAPDDSDASTQPGSDAEPTEDPATTEAPGHDHAAESHGIDSAAPVEVAGPEPRLGVTYDGGVLVVDGLSLDVLGDFPAEGFTRLNPAGDDRHLLLSTAAGFQVLDTGTWSEPHGNHDHSYTSAPSLTDLVFAADHPGHVVAHAGLTALFADGTGEITLFDPAELTASALPDTQAYTAPEAHHGVAVALEDGSLLQTVGDEASRSGASVGVPHGDHVDTTASSEQCPGVHGETVAAEERVVLGCEDGVLVYGDDAFTKIEAPDDYGRIGNLAGHAASPVVLGDYKTDPDAELERPTRIALIDTRAGELRLVDLGASYSFRSLARGADGEALVLTTDGSVTVLDPTTGDVEEQIPVVQPWEEPADWQDPRPTIRVQGDLAYVTEPASDALHVIDLIDAEVIDSVVLPRTPNELTSVGG